MALISLLKTWPGIFCLCNPRNLGMTSLLNMLPLAMPTVQREILDVLYGVFQLKVPEWTSSYYDAIISIGQRIHTRVFLLGRERKKTVCFFYFLFIRLYCFDAPTICSFSHSHLMGCGGNGIMIQ